MSSRQDEHVTAKFKKPIPYGAEKLSSLIMRRPKARDLLDLDLSGLSSLDADLIMQIAARISITPVVVEQLHELEVYDFMELTGKVGGFFASPEDEEEESPTTSTGHGPT